MDSPDQKSTKENFFLGGCSPSPTKEKRTPRREIVLTGVVASLLLYISLWQLLDILTPSNHKALVYSTLAILSGAVLFFLWEKYPKLMG